MTAETFFDPHQRATVEAAMARIIPTDDEPGAREAGADRLRRPLPLRHRLHLRQAGRQRLRDADRRPRRRLAAAHRDPAQDLCRGHRRPRSRCRRCFGAPFARLYAEPSRTRSCGLSTALGTQSASAGGRARRGPGAATDADRDRTRISAASRDAYAAGLLCRPDLWRQQRPRRLGGHRLPGTIAR